MANKNTYADFKVGDKVTVNQYHGLFFEGGTKTEFAVVGTVIKIVPNDRVGVCWHRQVRHPCQIAEGYSAGHCYWHFPWFLDKVDPFQDQVKAYVERSLAHG